MSKEQIKSLSDSGNVVAAHTWDHHTTNMVTTGTTIGKTQQKLEEIIGKPISDFAYPFWIVEYRCDT
jgi:peptidoglycan/xylan/chitin deacetylase (PgdA/CDA1 family)